MIKSRFDKFTVFGIYGVAIFAPILILLGYLYDLDNTDKFLIYFGFPLIGLATVGLWIIELPKIKIIHLTKTEVQFINPISRQVRNIDLNYIEGYRKQVQPIRFGTITSLLIYKDGQVIQEISSLYIKNFDALEKHLKSRIKYLGIEEFRYFNYLIQQIKRKIGT